MLKVISFLKKQWAQDRFCALSFEVTCWIAIAYIIATPFVLYYSPF